VGTRGSEEFPPGSSIVEIDFIGDHGATVIELVHRDIPDRQAPQHAVGWRHFLSRLSIAAAGGNPGPDPWAKHPPTGSEFTLGNAHRRDDDRRIHR